jgi:hypothetical protein
MRSCLRAIEHARERGDYPRHAHSWLRQAGAILIFGVLGTFGYPIEGVAKPTTIDVLIWEARDHYAHAHLGMVALAEDIAVGNIRPDIETLLSAYWRTGTQCRKLGPRKPDGWDAMSCMSSERPSAYPVSNLSECWETCALGNYLALSPEYTITSWGRSHVLESQCQFDCLAEIVGSIDDKPRGSRQIGAQLASGCVLAAPYQSASGDPQSHGACAQNESEDGKDRSGGCRDSLGSPVNRSKPMAPSSEHPFPTKPVVFGLFVSLVLVGAGACFVWWASR